MVGCGSRARAATAVALVAMLSTIGIPPGDAAAAERGSAAEAQAMVARAIQSFDADGAEKTFAAINAQDPAFHDKDLYVFVVKPDGVTVAHAGDPKLVGTNVTALKDAEGKEFGTAIVTEATPEGDWVDYYWRNYDDGKVEAKSSWVVGHGGYIFGVGIYRPEEESAERGTAAEAQAMVARAIQRFDAAGPAKTFAEIDAQDPAFRDRDLYVFVIGPDGRIAAHAGDVERIGLDLRDIRDHDDRPYGQMILDEATPEGVWIDYERLDYLSNKVLPKSSWVVRHKGYIFGVGIYKA